MAFQAILDEVDQLNLAGDRIEGLADHHPPCRKHHIHRRECSQYRDGIGIAGRDKAVGAEMVALSRVQRNPSSSLAYSVLIVQRPADSSRRRSISHV